MIEKLAMKLRKIKIFMKRMKRIIPELHKIKLLNSSLHFVPFRMTTLLTSVSN